MNLLSVEKPARYMGGEMGSIRKDVATCVSPWLFRMYMKSA